SVPGDRSIASYAEGIRTVAFVSTDHRSQRFFRKAWPTIPIHDDIKSFDADQCAGVDMLTGGVPCQPASRAGKQGGAADDRWLWPEALRVVAQAKPRVCVFENPPGIEDVGLDGILAALESEGYDISPVFAIRDFAVDRSEE